ncbi:MAG: T9SS type A sorting domain-containing protein [Saprospiraceae bacterium]|nr:T9SS type A sorting domain-containing protein [Saprospiraceae bacterium]
MKLLIVILTLANLQIIAQSLPLEMKFSADGKRLVSGGDPTDGFFQLNKIRRIELEFDQANYWTLLTSNYQSKTDLPARLIHDGKTYNDVGVRFKGQTSYQRVTTMKKSFNITMDYKDSTQNLKGYETINLNNSFEDNSFSREVFYENLTRPFSQSLKANFVHLFINGQDWGLYPCVQALDGDYVKEWFLSNEGARWRCERTTTGGGGPGGNFGAGTSTLNYLGDSPNLYTPHYTLKKSTITDHWEKLAFMTKVLNTVPLAQLEDTLNKVLDVDRALWFLAKEIMFGDDDSYINKGGMDYYCIYQKDVDRFVPLEYDANSVMSGNTATWSIFLKETNVQFPLANRLFAVPALRQRYLAHFRTMFKQALDSTHFVGTLNSIYGMIDTLVNSDPKKLMTYTAWQNEKNNLFNWMRNRRTFIQNNAEFKQAGVKIDWVKLATNGVLNENPGSYETAVITAKVENTAGTKKVNLYYGSGYDGKFTRIEMADDGKHGDEAAGDGIFGGEIPSFPQATFVRYYIESIANNSSSTAVYMPEGAEHDVFIYQVKVDPSSSNEVVINELMASNTNSIADQDGEYDDWIELYNKSKSPVDISGWILTDNSTNLDKYRVPTGTILMPESYLIIWADENGKQVGYHANFKLSSSGEEVFLLDSTGKQVDYVKFGQQESDKGYARMPNGTGSFIIQNHTFNKNNNTTKTSNPLSETEFDIYPNPARDIVFIESKSSNEFQYQLVNQLGVTILSGRATGETTLDIRNIPSGLYFIRINNGIKKLLVERH